MDQQIVKSEEKEVKPLQRKCPTPKELIELLRNETRWNLATRKYQLIHLEAVFEQLKKPINLSYLWLYWNYCENICNFLILPEYTQLKILNIGGNNIISVQTLQHANMPSLEELLLWNNKLTRVDSLRKMYVPNLLYIDVSSNFIVEWNRISEMHSTKLQIISSQYNSGMGNINSFAKLLAGPNKRIVNLYGSNMVSVLGKRGKKGKKQASKYLFPSQKVQYQ